MQYVARKDLKAGLLKACIAGLFKRGNLRGDLTAHIGALPAALRTVLTVVMLMLRTFFSTGGTNVRTQITYLLCIAALERQKMRGKTTNRGALHVQPDTSFHHANVFFVKAGCSTVITCFCALITFIDNLLIIDLHTSLLIKFNTFQSLNNISR
ncbi:hypothetical protein J1786_02300 [Rahnella sp. L72c]|uniref:Uncharacterized protein n=1 Tax=Rahnella perminowiae TaxID=2816244 RepID=A0ABS6KVZ2_9GAMM|nr:hypothetical protein [Rahnella perminowiae]